MLLLFFCIICLSIFSTLSIAGEISAGSSTDRVESSSQGDAAKAASVPSARGDMVQVISAPSDRIMTVMTVVLVSWIGIAFYLFRIDRKVSALEKKLDE